MILKTLTFSVLTATILIAAASPSPLNIGSRSVDTGGTKSAIEAYSDGGGVLVINQTSDTKIDNSAMNNLVFKYGEDAANNGVSLATEVKTISTTSTAQEKMLADKLNSTNLAFSAIPNGTTCNDYNSQTIKDAFNGGMCAGKMFSSPICSDVAMTYNTLTNICEKGSISTYAATGTIAGYTISGDSLIPGGIGIKKNGNTFYMYESDGSPTTGQSIYLKTDGTLSGISYTTNGSSYFGLKTVGSGFAPYNAGTGAAGVTIYKNGTGITTSSTYMSCSPNYYAGLIFVDINTFKYMYNYAGSITYGATISWVPFYSGYICPSGGTLSGTTCTINTYVTAPGMCQSGYTLTANQCIEN